MSDLSRHRPHQSRIAEELGRIADPIYSEENEEERDLWEYLAPLLSHWRLLALLAALAVIVTAVISKMWLTPWYQAQAEVKPLGSRLSSRMSFAGAALGDGGSALLSSMGMGGGGGDMYDQQTLTAILESYDFAVDLIRTYKLAPLLERESGRTNLSSWKQYQLFKSRLGVKYSMTDEMLNLTFADPDPAVAQRILAGCIELLRQRLRTEEIKQSRAAVASLQDEVRHTSDNLLADRLYEFIAQQIQRERLAEVQADLVFLVIEPPVVPDRPYWPRTSVNCLLAMVLTLLIAGLVIVVLEKSRAGAPVGSK